MKIVTMIGGVLLLLFQLSCKPSRREVEPVGFSTAFPSITLPPAVSGETFNVFSRDRLVYGRLEVSDTEWITFLEKNLIELKSDPERAKIEYDEMKGVSAEVEGIPPGWFAASETVEDLGFGGVFQLIVCRDGNSRVIYLNSN